jgi:sulfate permease, SulP family
MKFARFLPFRDLKSVGRADITTDFNSALTITFMAVPQGVAYALIAGLPPAMGLFAAALPAIAGSLMRSSHHVISGPTNALSLLVGGALAVSAGADPMAVAVTTAFLVGIFQVAAGFFRLGAIVDFISAPVVAGYITGAAILIGVGQLKNLSQTDAERGHLLHRIISWLDGLDEVSTAAMAMGLGTLALILVLKRFFPRVPAPMAAMAVATAVAMNLDLKATGLRVVADLSPVPQGFPPFTLPDFSLIPSLIPLAIAATVLSLVESSAVARSIAGETGQPLDADVEFSGQGFANLAAAFSGGYPVSGSLSRSALNHRAGGKSRFAGVFAGGLMLGVLLVLGPLVNYTPVAALAGLLLGVAWDLVDRSKIAALWRSGWSDRLSFLSTVLATWTLPLDLAIYVGVGLSLALVLRKTRLITVCEMGLNEAGAPIDRPVDCSDEAPCDTVRVLQVDGRLFFAAEGELRRLIAGTAAREGVQVLILRMRRSQGLDYTVASVLAESAEQLRGRGQRLILSGCRPDGITVLERSGALERIGSDSVFAGKERWFAAMTEALVSAHQDSSADHSCHFRPLLQAASNSSLGVDRPS